MQFTEIRVHTNMYISNHRHDMVSVRRSSWSLQHISRHNTVRNAPFDSIGEPLPTPAFQIISYAVCGGVTNL